MIYTDIDRFARSKLRPRTKHEYVYSQHRKYIRISAGFDIETTRIEKYAYMYIWQLSWDDDIILCRTWTDFENFVYKVNEWLQPKKATIIFWVANLGHEFSFLARRFTWEKIFARESHNPLTATTGSIEFRECLSISGQGGLANLAKNYCKTRKLYGDLDYNKRRNSQTPLDDLETQYCINDVRILSEWASYIFAEYSDKGHNIPLTSAGIVRGEIKECAAKKADIKEIRKAVFALYPSRDKYNEYMQFLFRGGYTHANIWYVGVRWKNTIGVDYDSSYPAVMLQKYYPMTPFVSCNCETDGRYITDDKLQSKCMIIRCNLYNVRRTTYHAIESENKIIRYTNAKFDNGRLYECEKMQVELTELDYDTYTKFYTWDKIEIVDSCCAERGKLPLYVREPLMKYYKIKYNLKKQGLDHTYEYKNAKARLNSFYGCMVTRLNFTEWRYNQDNDDLYNPRGEKIEIGEWYDEPSKKSYTQQAEKQILSPFWGIWVTAHARHNLLSCVAEMDDSTDEINVIYCDTDSIYFDDTPRNRAIIAKYNAVIKDYDARYLPEEFYKIGAFDWIDTDKNGDPVHYQFMTLGAKRYIKYYGDRAEITVSGMKKGTYERQICQPFATENSYPLYETYLDENQTEQKRRVGYVDVNDLFDRFTDNYILACDDSEKLASIYAHDTYSDTVTDEYGNTEVMTEMCGVALYPIPFTLKMDETYILLLQQILEGRRMPIWN